MPTIQGHRGCRGLLPENTIEACLKAVELGCDYIEIDVCVTGNNEILVSHDPYPSAKFCTHPTIKLTSENEKEFNFFRMNHNQIREFDCGAKQHKRFPQQQTLKTYKPLLKELVLELEKSSANNFLYNIEIKLEEPLDGIYFPNIENYVTVLLNELDDLHVTDQCILQSFDTRPLRLIHTLRPEIKLGYVVGYNNFETNMSLLDFKPYAYVAHYSLANKKLRRLTMENNIKLFVWTVNGMEVMDKMIALEVDSIITDYPNLLLQKIKSNL